MAETFNLKKKKRKKEERRKRAIVVSISSSWKLKTSYRWFQNLRFGNLKK